jgi:protein-disulfide isomerase
MKLGRLVSVCIVLFALPALAASPAEEEFARLLRATLKKHPEIVLDFLRGHSENILDIAQQGSNLRRRKNMESQWREDAKQSKRVALAGRPVLGSPDAAVTIIEFSDFTCPYCRQAAQVLDRIIKTHPGEVKFIFKHMPHGKDSPARIASEYFVAASLQNDQAPWVLYKLFFEEPERLTANAAAFAAQSAEQAGLDMKKLSAALKGKKIAAIIEEDIEDAKKLGVEGTPFFLVNNLVVRGAVAYDLFEAAVQTALRAAGEK